jgi:hypothetical protein
MGETPTAPKAVDGTHVSRNYVVFHTNSRLRTGLPQLFGRSRLEAAYEIMPQGALAAPMLAELDLRSSVESITVSWAGVCGSDSQTIGAIHRQSALHPSRTEAGIQTVCPPYRRDAITLRGRSRPTGSRAGPVPRRTRHPACFLCARGGIRSS